MQEESQNEVPTRFPSSHTSVPTFIPSPHIGMQTELLLQLQPASIVHVLEHPSPATRLWSSQASVNQSPSPQIAEQVQGVVALPPIHVHPVTGPEQSALHLSSPERSPSSQISVGMFLPSPQIGVQTLGLAALHVHPDSIRQAEEHPSLLFELLSSHASLPFLDPSPHIVVQVEAAVELPPVQLYPGAFPVQRALHPTAPFKSPSSQNSVPTFFPSPHVAIQVDRGDPEQVNPVSTTHKEEHPSPLTVDPSSQPSEEVLTPFPHVSIQVEGEVEEPPVQVQPETLPVQILLHLSRFDWSPSSQASVPRTLPSPQTGRQVEGIAAFEQDQPGSV